LFGTGFQLDKVRPEQFEKRLSWAEKIKHFNDIKEDEDRIVLLKQSIQNENPLIAVSAVHLFSRFYPAAAEEYFDEIILAPETPFHARLAIDHEFCLSRGQAWVGGKQKELESILDKESSAIPEGMGTSLLGFRKQMIQNGSWFGERNDSE